MRALVVGMMLCFSFGPSTFQGFGQPDGAAQALDAYIEAAVVAWESPGLAVAIVKDGQVVLSKGYGVRERGQVGPVDEHTLFAIGSTTKAMTAAAVGMLVDEGKLGWDDRVIDHLPWFRVADPFVTRELSIRDLLTHRAGLPNTDFLWYERDGEPADILSRMRFVEQETSMRTAFTYQNIMYAAAGAVVAEASEMSWEAFVRTRIFEPLGMTRTIATARTLDAQSNVASPHYRVDGDIRVIDNASTDAIAPAGSVWSSVHDMAKWMRFLLEGETEDGKELLASETLAELFEPQTLVDPDEFYPTRQLTKPHWMTYGLGWFQHDYDGRAVDFHTGSIDGMVAIHGLIRDQRLGVYVLGNLDHAELRHAILYRVFDTFGESPPRDWSAELKELYLSLEDRSRERAEEAEAARHRGTSPSLSLASYAARYADPLYGTVQVTGATELTLRVGAGLTGKMTHWHHDVFRVHWEASWRGTALVTFHLGSDGRIDGLELSGARYERERRAGSR